MTYISSVNKKLLKQLTDPNKSGYVYALMLENIKWYIGYTKNPERRFEQHFCGEGAQWTKLHKPVAIVSIEPANEALEKLRTIEYMNRYGVQNVRGYCWTSRFPITKAYGAVGKLLAKEFHKKNKHR